MLLYGYYKVSCLSDLGEFKRTLTETVLWTNSNPTSTFAAQTVALSDDINNYTYIKVEYRVDRSISTSSNVMISVNDFIANSTLGDTNKPKLSILYKGANTLCRIVSYASDTSIYFDTSYTLNRSGNANDTNIPLNIYGVK